MGLFDEVADGLFKSVLSSHGKENHLIESLLNLLRGPESGGLAGLADRFKQNGLGDVISSWIARGENLPISPDQIIEVLGTDQVQQIAEQLGLSSDETSGGLAQVLPQVVDRLTPQGSLPAEDLLAQSLSLMSEKLFGK